MTTNGSLLASYAQELKDAGLEAVNVSLYSLNGEIFREISGFDMLNDVLTGIDVAVSVGLRVKINSVLQENLNDSEWEDLLNLARDKPVDVRFIEMMPIGEAKSFHAVSNEELLSMIRAKYPNVTPDKRIHRNGPAIYFRISGFTGSVGFISAVNRKFCSSCNRIRLTSKGELKPCLCFADSFDLRGILRKTDFQNRHEKLIVSIRTAIESKPKAHSFEDEESVSEFHKMFEIGG